MTGFAIGLSLGLQFGACWIFYKVGIAKGRQLELKDMNEKLLKQEKSREEWNRRMTGI